MATVLTAQQTSPTAALVSWVTDQTPTGDWHISRDVDAAGYIDIGRVPVGQTEFLSTFDPPPVGATVTFRLWADAQPFTLADAIVWSDGNDGTVSPYHTEPRYTTIDRVKARLRIPDTNAGFDDRITSAIVSGEYAIDAELGRSFPEPGLGSSIPVALTEAATSVAVRIYKAGDAPAGVAGSEDQFGTLDLTEEVRSEISRQPILLGLKISWGLA